jgi:hypothetical protein
MEQQLLCPLCQGVSPGDASACTKCGARFAQADAVGTVASPWELAPRDAPAPAATAPPPAVQSEPAPQGTHWAAPKVSPAGPGWGVREQQGRSAPLLEMPATPLPRRGKVGVPPGQAAPRQGVGWRSWTAAVVVAVAIIGAGLYGAAHGWFGSGGSASLHNTLVAPASIAGSPALPNSSWTQIASTIRNELSYDQGISHSVASVYGTAASPQLIFVGVQGSGVTSTSTAQGLQEFAGLSNYVVAAASEVSSTSAGVPYVCGVVTGGSPAAICAFTDGQTRGFVWVVSSGDLHNALGIAEAAHGASLR